MTMKLAVSVLLALLMGAMVGWYAHSIPDVAVPAGHTAPPGKAPAARQILYYRNPMGLPDTSPTPKVDSMGMDYVPVYADEAPSTPGTVVLSPDKVQKLGVRTEQVAVRAWTDPLRASASVEIDPARRYVVAPRFEGWVERLDANRVGMSVRRGQSLMSVYSPELVSTQNEYALAVRAAQTLAAPDADAAAAMQRLADAALRRLSNFDIGPAQIARLRQGEVLRTLTLSAPADAVVLETLVTQGGRFMAGETVLAMADLSQLWLTVRIPAQSSGRVHLGLTASFSTDAMPGRQFDGRVSLIDPEIDPATRTLALRVELANADGALRPGLYGQVLLGDDTAARRLAVPTSAVLDSGRRRVVFVELATGRYEPRAVVLGAQSDGYSEVREGLVAGEVVVVAANFLIDAESNLRSVLDSMAAPSAAADSTASPAAEQTHDHRGGH